MGQTLNHTPLGIGHVGIGMLLVAAGFAAMALAKGSNAHRWAGRIFMIAMAMLAATGLALIVTGPPRALLTAWAALPGFYFALTGWLAARRQPPGPGASEIAGAGFAVFIGLSGLYLAATAQHARLGVLFVGSALAFAMAGIDLRIALTGGLSRAQRIRRHLWRMGLCVVIATAAIFVAQTQRFPVEIRAWLPWLVAPPLLFTLSQIFRYRPRKAAEKVSP